jgi:hypothetical protein
LLYGNVALWWLFSTGVSLDKLYHTAANSPLHNMVTHLTNVFAAAVGGYWAAKLGPGKPFVHAGVAGALMLVPVAIALLGPYEMPHPLWSLGLLFVTPIPSALLGGYWWQRRA